MFRRKKPAVLFSVFLIRSHLSCASEHIAKRVRKRNMETSRYKQHHDRHVSIQAMAEGPSGTQQHPCALRLKLWAEHHGGSCKTCVGHLWED